MILFPAIDLKGGACVRLLRGDMGSATTFNNDPGGQARLFASQGFPWIHVVDLDGAVAGKPVNAEAVSAILAAVDVPVQLGGGIRDLATIEQWLAAGVKRVILGTLALKRPDIVRDACRKFPGQVAVGIDARNGFVAVEGWEETSSLKALVLARRLADAGVAALIYTDIDRDGAMQGANVEATVELARVVPVPVIASGGIGSLDDLAKFKPHAVDGIAGVICGRALYDGRIDPAAAIALMAE